MWSDSLAFLGGVMNPDRLRQNENAVNLDKEIVHFDNLITSRKPSDLDAFNEELIKTLS
jgi:putative intracellular protease/amidase